MDNLQSWLNTLAQSTIALGVIYSVFQGVLARRAAIIAAAAAQAAAAGAAEIGQDIKQLTIQTDGIKDALVAATAKASHLEGRAEQKAETDAKNGI